MTASAADISADTLLKMAAQLEPMQRLFIRQQLCVPATQPSAFDGSLSLAEKIALYDDWLSGFDPAVVEKFQSGEWPV